MAVNDGDEAQALLTLAALQYWMSLVSTKAANRIQKLACLPRKEKRKLKCTRIQLHIKKFKRKLSTDKWIVEQSSGGYGNCQFPLKGRHVNVLISTSAIGPYSFRENYAKFPTTDKSNH
uniref:Uncharacterized protein n=1 Tax=Glossina pallidipes TaxID=7398 RepID=A0A1A9ZI10_GLOPL